MSNASVKISKLYINIAINVNFLVSLYHYPSLEYDIWAFISLNNHSRDIITPFLIRLHV